MGCYTKLNLDLKLKKDTPEKIILFIKKVINYPLSKLDFNYIYFDYEKWYMLFNGGNCDDDYQGSVLKKENQYWHLIIKTEFKNYDSEIDSFIEWISPFIVGRKKKQYLGYCETEGFNDRIYLHLER